MFDNATLPTPLAPAIRPPKRRYALVAFIASIFSTGLGQIYVGQAKRGWWFALALGLASSAICTLLWAPPSSIVAPLLPILFLLLFGLWLYAAIDAALTAHRLLAIDRTPGRWKTYVLLFVANCLAGAFVQAEIKHATWQTFRTGSDSMEPTLRANEIFVVWHGYFIDREPQRGDLATLVVPTSSLPYIKRIVGLPGDRVQLRDGRLFLNDEVVPSEAGPEIDRIERLGRILTPFFETLPGGRRYEIGRMSEANQFANTRELAVPPGYYFVLGDSRDNSIDSRMPTVGLIPRENLRDKPIFLFWAHDWRRIGQTLD